MKISEGLERIRLHPGDHYATNKPVVISTILGSCVSACMYDPQAGVAGMNHFLLANRRYAKNMPMNITEAGRYGVHAMELLINDLLKLGADRRNLRVKVFGGGAVIEKLEGNNFACVGEVNSRFVEEFIRLEKLRLEASDLGGIKGRVIFFRTDDYSVYRRYIIPRTTEEVESDEFEYWRWKVKDNEEKRGTAILFTPPKR